MEQSTKEKILALAEKVKNPPTWWWKVLGGLILFVMVIWIAYLLSKQREALAQQKTDAAKKKLDAEQAMVAAKVEADVVKSKNAEIAAQVALDNAKKQQQDILKIEADHARLAAQLNAVSNKDWDTLNKLAGVITPEAPK